MKFLLKNTTEYRFETINDVDAFEQEIRDLAAQQGFGISAFNKTCKVTKDDEYYVVKVTCVFNTAKDPISLVSFDYNFPQGTMAAGYDEGGF